MTQKHSMSARGLAVGYGDRTVIEGLDVDFPRGQITTIIGPNGCGKSTLLRAMSRLLPANEGEVLLDGADISSIRRKDLARTISVLPKPLPPRRDSTWLISSRAVGIHTNRGSVSGRPPTKPRCTRRWK